MTLNIRESASGKPVEEAPPHSPERKSAFSFSIELRWIVPVLLLIAVVIFKCFCESYRVPEEYVVVIPEICVKGKHHFNWSGMSKVIQLAAQDEKRQLNLNVLRPDGKFIF